MKLDLPPLRPPPSTLSLGSTVWAYLRDSGGPLQDRSIAQQRDIIQEYCKAHQLTLVRIFSDVHKSGGSTTLRDDFNEMVATSASESLRPRGLLIWNFARFARDLDDSQIYKGILRKRGVIIHSLTDPIPEGPYANVIETLIHVADEQKKHEAALGSWRGLRHIVKQGAMPGTPPRGFKRAPIKVTSENGTERQAHRWIPDPEFKTRIRRAFQMRAAGHSLDEINKTTRLFGSLNSYRTFFNNKLYIGILEFGTLTIEDYSKPIVTRSIWDKVQKRQAAFTQKRHLKTGAQEHPRRNHSPFILSGLVQCARCKSPLYGHTSHQRDKTKLEAYRCTRAKRRRDCDLPRIPSHALEQAVIKKLQETLSDENYMTALVDEARRHSAAAHDLAKEKRHALEADLRKLNRQISNITNAIAEKGHSQPLLKKLDLLEKDQLDLKSQLAQLPLNSSSPNLGESGFSRRGLGVGLDRLPTAPPELAHQILRRYVASVTIDRVADRLYGKIEIYLPPEDAAPLPGSPPQDYNPTTPTIPVPSTSTTLGAPRYRHSIAFECPIIRKPRSK